MFPSAKVLAIDNDEDDLEMIRDGLHAAGIACMPILFSPASPPLEAPLQGVRIVFLDLNLVDGHLDSAQLADSAAAALKQYIAHGPYLLVFWSGHSDQAQEVLRHMRERHTDAPAPLALGIMEKTELVLPDKDNPEYAIRLEILKQRIIQEVSTSPQLMALLHWEARLATSAAEVFGELHALAAGSNYWDFTRVRQQFETLLCKVAKEAGGVHADENLAMSIGRGLAPLLDDFLYSSLPDEKYEAIWRGAMPADLGSCKNLPAGVNPAQLNSRCLYDLRPPAATDRGALVEIPLDADWESSFNKERDDLIAASYNLDDCANPGELLNECRCFLLEFSAACDHAQGKERLFRYVFCTLTPVAFFRTRKGKVLKVYHEAIHRFPPLMVNGKAMMLEANFRHVLGLPARHQLLGRTLLRIRPQALDEMAQHYANHTSRLGIISFH